jgi:hypothetical protein
MRTEEKDFKKAEALLKEDILKKLDKKQDKKVIVEAEKQLAKP